jgi:formyltetrahydrofolate deformylase
MANDHILTLSCPDKPGIVHAVTAIFARHGHNILDLQQFSDPVAVRFFMRVHFGASASTSTSTAAASTTAAAKTPSSSHDDNDNKTDNPDTSSSSPATTSHLTPLFDDLASAYSMTYSIRPASQRTRVLIMVSKIGHCLNDLLFRMRTTQLRIEVPLIVSNHADFADLAASYGAEFHHLPVTRDNKAEQERKVLELIEKHDIELVVLARYMQVLSPTLCAAMSGRIINIHHSFLPSFKGAKPYHQAYERGVKIIGATAHFVTKDLDEGPIIEQSVARIDHSMNPKKLAEEGSNVESLVLATAVRWYADMRVFLNGPKTVVFA